MTDTEHRLEINETSEKENPWVWKVCNKHGSLIDSNIEGFVTAEACIRDLRSKYPEGDIHGLDGNDYDN